MNPFIAELLQLMSAPGLAISKRKEKIKCIHKNRHTGRRQSKISQNRYMLAKQGLSRVIQNGQIISKQKQKQNQPSS